MSEKNYNQKKNYHDKLDFISIQKSKYIKRSIKNKSISIDSLSSKQSYQSLKKKKKNKNYKSENQIYSKMLPVQLREKNRENRQTFLEIKIFNNFKQKKPKYLIRLTSKENLHFLKILDLNEDNFYKLKSQQNFLIEFQQFSKKFIELLELCMDLDDLGKVKFTCELEINDNFNVFKIVELNELRQLDHLVLNFEQPDDSVVIEYLSNCFKEKNDKEIELEKKIGSLKGFLKSEKEQNMELKKNLEEISKSKTNLDEKNQILLQTQVNKLKEENVEAIKKERKEREDEKRKLTEIIEKNEKEYKFQISELRENLQNNIIELSKVKFNEKEIKNKYKLLEKEYNSNMLILEKKNEDLRNIRENLIEKEQELRENMVRLEYYEKQNEENEEGKKRLDNNINFYVDNIKKQEKEISELKTYNAKLEKKIYQSSSEIKKANEILEIMEKEIKKKKKEIKNLKNVFLQQEKLIEEKTQNYEDTKKELNGKIYIIKEKENKSEELNQEINLLNNKLEQSKKKIEQNNSTINYLNERLNEGDNYLLKKNLKNFNTIDYNNKGDNYLLKKNQNFNTIDYNNKGDNYLLNKNQNFNTIDYNNKGENYLLKNNLKNFNTIDYKEIKKNGLYSDLNENNSDKIGFLKQSYKNDTDVGLKKKFDFKSLNHKYGFSKNFEDGNNGFDKTVSKKKEFEENMDFMNNPPRSITPVKFKKPENPNFDDVFN